jgi:putative photosynthetic complex assembly protein 2
VSDHILPVLYTLFLWWFSTGLIVWLDGLPQRTFRWSLGAATLLATAALYGLAAS